MGRWEPGSWGRLEMAALELYAERGYDNTTVADIAERAGVTERTFFRHYADKREVLFNGSDRLQAEMVAAARSAPAGSAPYDVVAAALQGMASMLEGRSAMSAVRAQVVAASRELQERELRKMAALSQALAEVLTDRGTEELTARLVAEAGVGAFRVGYSQWITDTDRESLSETLERALALLRAAT